MKDTTKTKTMIVWTTYSQMHVLLFACSLVAVSMTSSLMIINGFTVRPTVLRDRLVSSSSSSNSRRTFAVEKTVVENSSFLLLQSLNGDTNDDDVVSSSIPLEGVGIERSRREEAETTLDNDDDSGSRSDGADDTQAGSSPYTDPNDTRYSASDWLHNVKSMRYSSILREIRGPVLTITAWSSIVALIYKTLSSSSQGRSNLAKKMCISTAPHSFLVSALGLLLVFRTNSAYQRFAEGRKIWEKILSISRNFSRMSLLYEHDLTSDRRKRVQHLLAAFPYLLRHHIQPQGLDHARCEELAATPEHMLLLREPPSQQQQDGSIDGSGQYGSSDRVTFFKDVYNKRREERAAGKKFDTRDYWIDLRSVPWCLLPKSTLRKCVNAPNRPLWICDRLSYEITNVPNSLNFTSRERLTLLGHVDSLSKCIGECERIHQTAVPLNYARHSLRSLTIWLFTLPFGLINELGFLTGPVMGIIAWLLFGVYQIGYSIEDPFQGSLRLSILCDAIYQDVMAMNSANVVGMMGTQRETAFEITKDELIEWDSAIVTSSMSGSTRAPLIRCSNN